MKKLLTAGLLFLINHALIAQVPAGWHGKKCAVALTYDDALQVHLDKVIPVLDSLGLKGTFYLSGNFPGVRARLNDWKKAAAHGHELGNHTLFHPCTSQKPGRSWVNPTYDLSKYTVPRIVDEIRMTNTLLAAIDGKTQRTFAYPCGDTKIGDVDYFAQVKNDFVAARGVTTEMRRASEINLADVGAYGMNGESGEEMIALVKKAMETNSVLVFLFHGVGGEHNLNVALPEHNKLVRFLKQHEKEVWIAPFIDVAQSVNQTNAKPNKSGR
ncbi:polysaccharide deacetylase family protein [Spirosoma taeanense]|uniref:Polysaccharide deacetylase family protein n=1 Tax=Spirosoma taeanense TaxID=2735870 RepID=A0A6M5YE09_9BACT|nr:polysaccharide deacetylase family protein [Spirosoma taeanense]QJW91556.1 polysaccharide deacetylase family protein [Spirosoma taeanense]